MSTSASNSGLLENFEERKPVLGSAQAQIAPAAAPATHFAGSAARPAMTESDTHDADHMDVNKTLLNIRGFGDFGLYGGNQKQETTSFSLGQLNLFITSNIAERFKVLTELVFEVHQNNDFEEDLERILLTYSLSDYFKLSAGRYHTAIGYYNTAFHHTTWFQTATGRPFIFSYEDEGGILPIHNVGVEASGQIPSGKLGLHYVAEVGNGRSSERNPAVEPVQNFVDENNRKSINLALFALPEAFPGAQLGFSVYRDVLYPPNSVAIGETIVDAYAVISRSKFEWLNEGLVIRHTPRGMHGFETPAFYSQISRRFGMVTACISGRRLPFFDLETESIFVGEGSIRQWKSPSRQTSRNPVPFRTATWARQPISSSPAVLQFNANTDGHIKRKKTIDSFMWVRSYIP